MALVFHANWPTCQLSVVKKKKKKRSVKMLLLHYVNVLLSHSKGNLTPASQNQTICLYLWQVRQHCGKCSYCTQNVVPITYTVVSCAFSVCSHLLLCLFFLFSLLLRLLCLHIKYGQSHHIISAFHPPCFYPSFLSAFIYPDFLYTVPLLRFHPSPLSPSSSFRLLCFQV